MIEIAFEGLDALEDRLSALPGTLTETLLAKAQILSQQLTDTVKQKLSGEVLQTRTGRLKDSIASQINNDDNVVGASVYVDGDVPYAAIQEYGGATKAHIIEALNGKALAFNWQGKTAFFRSVQHPGSNIPERSYLRSSLDDMQDDITAGFADALGEALESA